MGGILSAEEKNIRQNFRERSYKKQIKRFVSFEDIYRCQKSDNSFTQREDHKARNNRNFSLYNRHGARIRGPQKSQSLDTIFEELSKDESNDAKRDTKEDIQFKLNKPLIPRIKLKTKNRVKTKRNTNPSSIMSAIPDSPESWKKLATENDKRIIEDTTITNEQSSIITDEKISKKPDDNYFTKNFDECMKRLHLLEKEHELMEKDSSDVQLFYLQNENCENEGTKEIENTTSENITHGEGEASQSKEEDSKTGESPKGTSDFDNSSRKTLQGKFSENQQRFESNDEDDDDDDSLANLNKKDSTVDENRELISKWYSNLKQQFEKNDQEAKKEKTKEMSCRIMGATLKNTSETVKMDDRENDTRHYFSKLVKSNRSLIDEELPDPDIVKNIRAKFQENLDSTLQRRLNNKLGGSLQNINSGKVQSQQVWRPLSAQCNRDDIIREIQGNSIGNEKENSTDSVKDSGKEHSVSRMRLAKKFEKDLKSSKEGRNGRLFLSKWTDSGSVSSGVSSDLSSYDTDLESYSKEEPEPEPDDIITISDDDLLDEVKDKHYVQNEILEKIRSFGTSVTYYGGEMITCSVGPLLSPTTQAIMEEITEKYRQEKNISRTFEEFYRKYFETYDSSKKKKVGRTRSFGQTDVFHRPNILNNTEIEMYKYDLEMEIGIRKPKGLSKVNAIKPKPLENHIKTNEIPEEKEIITQVEDTESDKVDEQQSCPVTIVIEESKNETEESSQTNEQETNLNDSVTETDPSVSPGEKSKEEIQEKPLTNEKTPYQKLPFERSQSTPHEMMKTAVESDQGVDSFKASSTEILFGYDKKLFNENKVSDIEFEEYQVCDTGFEKIRRFSETNIRDEREEAQERQNNKKTFSPPNGESKQVDQNEENNNAANKENLEYSTNSFQSHYGHNERGGIQVAGLSGKPKKKNMRWPIETRGAIDIQKNVQSSGIVVISSGKSSKSTN